MKRKLFLFALAAEALLCVLLTVLNSPVDDLFLSLISFPFEQIGDGLRALSLSGAAGNAFAFLIYAVFCLLPTCALLFIRRKRPLSPEDGLLPVLSVILYAAVYCLINPGLIAGQFQGIPAGKAAFSQQTKALFPVCRLKTTWGLLPLLFLWEQDSCRHSHSQKL